MSIILSTESACEYVREEMTLGAYRNISISFVEMTACDGQDVCQVKGTYEDSYGDQESFIWDVWIESNGEIYGEW